MKREIKFRAWCQSLSEMVEITDIHFRENMVAFKSRENEDVWNMEHFNIMQFIGLKDSNGLDIYEGDIIDTGSGSITHVEFKNGGFFYTSYYSKNFTNDEVYFGGHHYLNDILTRFKVIGNIYQNPELIN